MRTFVIRRLLRHLLIISLVTAIAAVALACIQAPVEQRAVTNKLSASHPVNTSVTSAEAQQEPNQTEAEDTPGHSDEDEQDMSDTSDQPTDNSESDENDTDIDDENEELVSSGRPEETTLSFELEGMTETIQANLLVSQLGYSLYYDSVGYQAIANAENLETGYQADEVRLAEPISELPDMFIRVYHLNDLNLEAASDYMKRLVSERFELVSEPEAIIFAAAQYQANTFTAQSGSDWDSVFVKVTILSDESNGAYAVFSQYFLGAAEGHGSRFAQMLNTFEIES